MSQERKKLGQKGEIDSFFFLVSIWQLIYFYLLAEFKGILHMQNVLFISPVPLYQLYDTGHNSEIFCNLFSTAENNALGSHL